MTSPPENSKRVRLIDPREAGISIREPLNIYPFEYESASGWIGLQKETIVWISFGSLDREALKKYWSGPFKEGKRCPVKVELLAEAAKGDASLKLCPIGTPFQRKVWQHLICIPFSTTRTYGEIASELGSANHARAVGTAVGANPIAWLIPCHRVLPASGKTGAYRWGSNYKKMLLEWENGSPKKESINPIPEGKQKLEAMLLKAQRFEDIAKLAGDIAHDLNNLLAPIGMSTQLLKRKMQDESLNRYVDIIETSTGRARSVIQEILTFSRETEGGEVEIIAVHPLLKEIEKIVRETFPDRLEADFQYSPTSTKIRIDPTQFHRAILNILVNARDAIKGKGRITLQESVHDLKMKVSVGDRQLVPGRFVCISISDTGCGIPEDIREQIFDPFFTTKPKEEGTGLGLASVYGIIARAGGFIDLESTPGEGSTFHIYLPQPKS
ncbi:methylated-DNA--[protein]-cysteine S-methyltransferase [Puniceicoccales bacterium CK1056]|uniref:Methylated-DNA--[protein]-cysteine S-methyltransferase n=1 Tax=Oceanipulchritudo coccoides TaxID=2706888 RepID=A0A6B2M2C1_9BACT|nr:methylated-DNA--[protein]-cysteine S-methyltransferase [Oceanipulchritudo coccoides]NDV62349.1 methylated-DNA--[protein]-cysteine S-methyltransferase [Oceanipulchritudo coccoides]